MASVHGLPAQWEFSAFCIFGKGQKWSKTQGICAGGQWNINMVICASLFLVSINNLH